MDENFLKQRVGSSFVARELEFEICNGHNDILPPLGFREAVIEGALEGIRHWRQVDPEQYRDFVTTRVDTMIADQFYTEEEAREKFPGEYSEYTLRDVDISRKSGER